MLKRCQITAQKLILSIHNELWNACYYIPGRWTSALVLSFSDLNKPVSIKGNFRPIAITSCIGKLLEKIVNCCFVHLLENQDLLLNHQYKFRKTHFRTDAMIRITSEVLSTFIWSHDGLSLFFFTWTDTSVVIFCMALA